MMRAREDLIRSLCEERGCWGDGTEATDQSIADAAACPDHYRIDADDLDAALTGDVGAIIRLRDIWGLGVVS